MHSQPGRARQSEYFRTWGQHQKKLRMTQCGFTSPGRSTWKEKGRLPASQSPAAAQSTVSSWETWLPNHVQTLSLGTRVLLCVPQGTQLEREHDITRFRSSTPADCQHPSTCTTQIPVGGCGTQATYMVPPAYMSQTWKRPFLKSQIQQPLEKNAVWQNINSEGTCYPSGFRTRVNQTRIDFVKGRKTRETCIGMETSF